MAYEKQKFTDGDVLTAAHLNHIEEGIGNNDAGLDNLAEIVSDVFDRVSDLENNTSASIIATAQGEVVALADSTDNPLLGLNVYGKTIQNGTPTPTAPVLLESFGGHAAGEQVRVTGKNLFGVQNLESAVAQGGRITIQDGVITRTATVTANIVNIIPTELADCIIPTRLSPGTYMYSIDYLEKPPQWLTSTYSYLKVVLDDGTAVNIREGVATQLTQSGVVSGVCVSILSMTIGDVLRIRPQLEVGTVSTAYEPYKAQQELTFYNFDGLPGIPVASGGNYTDETGQQWVCDTVDFTRGVYVQRIGNRTFTGDETDDWRPNTGGNETAVKHFYATVLAGSVSLGYPNVLCTMLTYNSNAGSGNSTQINVCRLNPSYGYLLVDVDVTEFSTLEEFKTYLAEKPMTVSYVLATPVETPIDAEILAAYSKLNTYYPNTTVTADGANLAVTYVADTKNYIDNKFAELAAAIVNN